MSLTNFPNGFPGGVTIRGIPILNLYTGNVWWVDSVNGSNIQDGKDIERPKASLAYLFDNSLVAAGDIVFLKPGHVETVIAAAGLDLDIAGVCVVFLGQGTNKAYITFTTVVGADMDIDAANITLINPKFVAGIDALTGPIDVNSTDFTIVNGEYHDGTAIDTTDCIVTAAGATRLTIDGWRYFKGDEAGTAKQSNIQINGVDEMFLRDIYIAGDFGTGNIENVTDEFLNGHLENIFLNNTNAGPIPCMVIDANATGFAKNVKCRVASGSTFVSSVGKIQWANDSEGFSTDGYAGDPIGTALSTGIEGKIDTIDAVLGALNDAAASGAVTNTDTAIAYLKQLVTEGIARDAVLAVLGAVDTAAASGAVTNTDLLMAYVKQLVTELQVVDEFMDVPAANNVLNAQINEVLGNKEDTAATGAVTTTDTLVAYIKQLVTELAVIDEFHDVPAANNVLNAQINEVIGNKEDTAAAGAVTTTDTAMAYIKQLVTAAVADAVLSGSRKKVIADDLVAADITGTATRFTITGGPIRVLSLGVWVSTAIPAGANTLQFGYTPAGGGGANTLSGATDTASAAADQLFMLDGVKATGPVKTTDVGVLAGGQLLISTPIQGIILAPGVVQTIFSAGPPATGAMTVFMEYEPMTPTAAVA